MNNFNIAGNISTELELRTLPNDKATKVVEAKLAVDRPTAGGDTDFLPFVAYGKQAESLAAYNAKGSAIAISGHLKLDHWEDRQSGENRQRLVLVADRITYLDRKRS